MIFDKKFYIAVILVSLVIAIAVISSTIISTNSKERIAMEERQLRKELVFKEVEMEKQKLRAEREELEAQKQALEARKLNP